MATQTLIEESTSRFVQAGHIKLHYNEAGPSAGLPGLASSGAGRRGTGRRGG